MCDEARLRAPLPRSSGLRRRGVCESGDTFARGRELPRCDRGDAVLIGGTGAYAASMASTCNSRPLRAEVLLDAGRYAIVRREQTHDELMAAETLPDSWLSL
jgi:diaminopimelate decarboxylase